MDTFDIESLESYVKRYKRDIVGKLETYKFNDKNFSNQSDLLTIVLDYTPKLKETQIFSLSKIKLKEKQESEITMLLKHKSNYSLNLEKTNEDDDNISNNDESSDEEIKGKKNIFSSKNNSKIFIKEIIYNIIDNIINPSTQNLNNNNNNNLLSKGKIRIYILNTENFIDFDIKLDELFINLKKRVLNKLENVVNLNLKYHSIDGYEFRYIQKSPSFIHSKLEKNNYSPNMTISPINENDSINEIGKDTICFIEKKDYIPENKDIIKLRPKLYGTILSNNTEEMKINLKIYIKVNKTNTSSTIIQLNIKNNLKTVFEKIILKNKLQYRNIELYYFVEHEDNNEDMDNALSWEMELKYLSTYELDLYTKKFADVPNLLEMSQSYRLNLSENSRKSKLNDENNNYNEYIFTESTAGVYQEFEVIKINKYGNRQERTLGIDMYNLYNDMPKNKKNTSGLFNFHSKTKKPLRKIKDITQCGIISDKSFFINIFDNDSNIIRELKYEVKNKNIRNEIIAKINYLINMNKTDRKLNKK